MPDLTPEVERELEAIDHALEGRRVAADLTELGELALLLREERPQPSDGFVRHLDHRAARGFPGRDPRARASGRRWLAWHGWMGPALGVATTAMLIALVGVLGSGGSDDSESGGSGGGQVAMQEAAPNAGGGGTASDNAGAVEESTSGRSAEGDEAASLTAPVPPIAPGQGNPGTDGRENRKVERSASLRLAAPPRAINDVSREIQRVTNEYDGFVVTSTVNSSRNGGRATFELRIPTRNLDDAISDLAGLAAVRERSQRSEDITAQAVSARSQLKDARTERKSLLVQLGEADTVQKTAAIRARLRIVSAEIERARAGVRRVQNRASFATVAVTLVADRSAAAAGEDDSGAWTPGDAWNDALRVLEVIAGVALIALAVALPLALLALLVGLALRFGRRRSREHALDAV